MTYCFCGPWFTLWSLNVLVILNDFFNDSWPILFNIIDCFFWHLTYCDPFWLYNSWPFVILTYLYNPLLTLWPVNYCSQWQNLWSLTYFVILTYLSNHDCLWVFFLSFCDPWLALWSLTIYVIFDCLCDLWLFLSLSFLLTQWPTLWSSTDFVTFGFLLIFDILCDPWFFVILEFFVILYLIFLILDFVINDFVILTYIETHSWLWPFVLSLTIFVILHLICYPQIVCDHLQKFVILHWDNDSWLNILSFTDFMILGCYYDYQLLIDLFVPWSKISLSKTTS